MSRKEIRNMCWFHLAISIGAAFFISKRWGADVGLLSMLVLSIANNVAGLAMESLAEIRDEMMAFNQRYRRDSERAEESSEEEAQCQQK